MRSLKAKCSDAGRLTKSVIHLTGHVLTCMLHNVTEQPSIDGSNEVAETARMK
jgi:hypothetical protein